MLPPTSAVVLVQSDSECESSDSVKMTGRYASLLLYLFASRPNCTSLKDAHGTLGGCAGGVGDGAQASKRHGDAAAILV